MQTVNREVIFGVHAVMEMLKSGSSELSEILFSEGSEREAMRDIRALAQRCNVPVVVTDSKMLDRLAVGRRHQGVVACVKPYRYLPFAEILGRIARVNGPQRILILDGITDPGNLGALIRTADAAGVHYIVIPKDRSAEVTPVVTKAAAGATAHVAICKVANLRRAIVDLKKAGFWVVALDSASSRTIYDEKFPDKLVVVLGSEGSGVRPINLRESDFILSIPMLGTITSLNVSVAGAVCLYEVVRQSISGRKSTASGTAPENGEK